LGTFDIDAGQLSFEDKVEMLIEAEPAAGVKRMEEEQGQWNHTEWPDGVTVAIYPYERERHHRPEVSDEVLDELDEWVQMVYPNIPVDSVDFEDKLGLLIDSAEEYYGILDCTLVVGTDKKDRAAAVIEDALTGDLQDASGLK
jgi:hypothetical protein